MSNNKGKQERVELHAHTKMSAMDGIVSATDLINRAAEWGHTAIAITDHGTAQAFPEAYRAANNIKNSGKEFKVIYGMEGYLIDDEASAVCSAAAEGADVTYYHIILLVKNHTGLKNLYKLISKSHIDYFYKKPRIPKSVLRKFREGILLGSACGSGELFGAVAEHQSEAEIEKIAEFYDYFEIQPIGNNEFMVRDGYIANDEELRNLNRKIVELGDLMGKTVVADCDVHFMDPEDEICRRVLKSRNADFREPLYFRTTDEMLEEFGYLGEEKAYELVVTNTNKIAAQIEGIKPIKDGFYPPSLENSDRDLVDICRAKAHEIYGEMLPQIVKERMEREFDSILKNGFSVMYMIAHKLVKKSNEAGYSVGSRGSLGASFVAFLAGITEINSLCPHYICEKCKHSEFFDSGEYQAGIDMPDKICSECGEKMKKDGLNIPFETFSGFYGDKVPDIDLNFSDEYVAAAHRHIVELFGKEFVFRAGTIRAIANITAVGLARRYFEQEKTEVTEEEIRRIAEKITYVKRTDGEHPGGVFICPNTMDIYDFCPIQYLPNRSGADMQTTHFDYHFLQDNMLKPDILGHSDPTIIHILEDLTGVCAKDIPLNDKRVMECIVSAETLGVPELGIPFVRNLLKITKPTTFGELVKISGLSHGTNVWKNNAQNLIESGAAALSEVIALRDDIMIYLISKGVDAKTAFEIMEFVRKGRAEREGLPKEYEQVMKAQGVPDWYIESCKKIMYIFPKAHAAAYVMFAVRIAYFKVYYPAQFYAAYLKLYVGADAVELLTRGKDLYSKKDRAFAQYLQENNDAEPDIFYDENVEKICSEIYERGLEDEVLQLIKMAK